MSKKIIIPGLILVLCTTLAAQSMIGVPKEEVEQIVKKQHRGFRKDNTIVRQRFNYLKYVNGLKTRTWILYFDDEDICKSAKLVCDYSEYDDVVEDLTQSYRKVDDSRWEYTHENEKIQVVLTKQEWYFTVRESKKE